MKKKKQKPVAEAEGDAGEDLECVIREHTLFFDKLIEVIPAKFYLATDDRDMPWFQGLSKAAKAEAKKETKENIKKSRRHRLDPHKTPATTLDLLKQSLGKQKVNDSDQEQPFMSGLEGDDRSVTYEELRQRLQRKLEEFRASRNCGNPVKKDDRNVKKRKRDSHSGTEESKAAPNESIQKVKKDAAEASKELVFGLVQLANDEMQGKEKRRKVSKYKELERAKKLEDTKKNDP